MPCRVGFSAPARTGARKAKSNFLQALRLRASQDSADLVESYQQTLDGYLQNRSKTGGRKGKMSPEARLAVSDTIKRLDFLDTRRDALSKRTNAPAPQLTISR